MAKTILFESQRQAVVLAVASPANGAMESTHDSVESRQRRQRPLRVEGLFLPGTRLHQVCDACHNVNEKPTSIGQMHMQLPGKPGGMMTRSVRECPPGGRVPIVALKRGNARGAKGNRIPVKSRIQREDMTS
jgi:hypothetical protein